MKWNLTDSSTLPRPSSTTEAKEKMSVEPAYIPRVVLDTNIILRGLLSPHSASSKLLRRCENRDFIVLLSKHVIAEYRFIISSPQIRQRFPALNPTGIESVLARLRYVGELVDVRRRFAFPRDPRDAKLLELAV